jgi:hypothetical protein
MSTPERVSRIPQQDDDSSAQNETYRSTAYHAKTRRTEKRFEIGFFIRKRVRRAVAYYRQLALLRLRSAAPAAQPNLPAPLPAPPSEEGEETGSPTAMKAFSVRSGQGQGGGGDLGADEPDASTQGVMGEDDGGPIEGTSFEIGGFVSSTTESTTDDT